MSAPTTAPGWSTPRRATAPRTTRTGLAVQPARRSARSMPRAGSPTRPRRSWVGKNVWQGQPRRDRRAAPRRRGSTSSTRLLVQPQLSPLLAVQEAGDLPRHRAMVRRRRPRRPPPEAPSQKINDEVSLASRLGAVADRAPWSPAVLTGASAASAPGACRSRPWAARSCDHPVADCRHRPPLPRPVPRPRRRRLVLASRRGRPAARPGPPAPSVRRDRSSRKGRGHPRRLVRIRFEPSGCAEGAVLRARRLPRLSSTWRGRTSIAAGSSRRS